MSAHQEISFETEICQHLLAHGWLFSTAKDRAAHLEACAEGAPCDVAFLAKALGDVARARGVTRVAREAGVTPKSLYAGPHHSRPRGHLRGGPRGRGGAVGCRAGSASCVSTSFPGLRIRVLPYSA
jgi:hypothetical protein